MGKRDVNDPKYEGKYPNKLVAYTTLKETLDREERINSLVGDMKFNLVFLVLYILYVFSQCQILIRQETHLAITSSFVRSPFPQRPNSSVYIRYEHISNKEEYWQCKI